MLFKFGLDLLNLHLNYLQIILRIDLLKFNCKRRKFVKSGAFSTQKFSIVGLTGFVTVANWMYILIFVPLCKVETMFVAVLTVGFVLGLIVLASLLLYLDDFKFLPNIAK